MDTIWWVVEECCCCRRKEKKRIKRKDSEKINRKALKLLEQWKVDQYANNRFLHNIPQERIDRQLQIILRELNNTL